MRHTRREFLIGTSFASAAIAFPVRPLPPLNGGTLRGSIRDAIQASLHVNGCPGTAVAIAKGENPIITEVMGQANLETGTVLSEAGVFRIGSLTKQFTAVAVLKLVEKGKITLDGPVASYLPGFSSLPAFTARELLNHTAGLHSEESDTICVYSSDRSQIAVAQEIAKQKQVFDFAPGTAWLYSNSNYVVLGAIIESVYGNPLSVAMEDLIFHPLQLNSTAFDHSAAVVPGRVAGYTPTAEQATPYSHAKWIPIEEAGGAGAARSTIRDLCRWQNQLFGGHVLTGDSLKELLEPGRLRNGALASTHRFSAGDSAMGDVQYAMGFLVPPPTTTGRSAIHYGYINGFSACLERFIDQSMTLAILCNADSNPGLPIREIRRRVRDNLSLL